MFIIAFKKYNSPKPEILVKSENAVNYMILKERFVGGKIWILYYLL